MFSISSFSQYSSGQEIVIDEIYKLLPELFVILNLKTRSSLLVVTSLATTAQAPAVGVGVCVEVFVGMGRDVNVAVGAPRGV
jgi:hypothetical protein